MTLAWLRPARHDKRDPDRPPQRQCRDRAAHAAHRYEDDHGSTWSCQGRRKAK